MKEKFDDNSYNNYSILSTNLTCGSQKFKKIYGMSSPVLIQSYGNNNFVVEFKYKKKNNNNNDEYDYIENELKKTRKNKAYTTCTELSNEESVFFNSQFSRPNRRYYNDYNNFDENYQNNIYNTNNTNYNIDKRNQNLNKRIKEQKKYYYQNQINCQKEERDRDDMYYPTEKNYMNKQKINNINNNNNNDSNMNNFYYYSNYNVPNNNNNNNNDLKYQRFCESFISKNPKRNTITSKPKNTRRNENNFNAFNVNNITYEKKERSVSKTKNQLDEFNIDKLKEIGDCYALRHRRLNNFQNGFNIKNNNDIKNNIDRNDVHNSIINNFINIDKQRKESKSKMNLHNKTEEKIYNTNDKLRNDVLYTKNSYEIKSLYDSNTTNSNSNNTNYNNTTTNINNEKDCTKLLKVNRNEALLKNHPMPNVKKIRATNIIKRKKFILKGNNFFNTDADAEGHNTNDNNENLNKDIANNNNNNNGLNNIKSRINHRTYLSIQNRRNYNSNNNSNNNSNSNYYNVYNKTASIINKNREEERNEKLVKKNVNHNYVETINIKNKK